MTITNIRPGERIKVASRGVTPTEQAAALAAGLATKADVAIETEVIAARDGEANLHAQIVLRTLKTTTVTGGGLATGGGDLSGTPRIITVPKASGAEAAAGIDDTKALTALALATPRAADAAIRDSADSVFYDSIERQGAVQSYGPPGTPVTGTALTGKMFAFGLPVERSGWARLREAFALIDYTLVIKRVARTGTAMNKVAGTPDLEIPLVSGLNAEKSIKELGNYWVEAGEYIAFYPGSSATPRTSDDYPDGLYSAESGSGEQDSWSDSALQTDVTPQFVIEIVSATVSDERLSDAERQADVARKAVQEIGEQTGSVPASLAISAYGGVNIDFGNVDDSYEDTARTDPVTADGDTVGGVKDRAWDSHHYSQATGIQRPTMRLGVAGFRSALELDGTTWLSAEKLDVTQDRSTIDVIAVCRRDDLNDTRPIVDHKINVTTNSRIQMGNFSGGGLKTRPTAGMRRTDAGAFAFAYGVHGGLEFVEPTPGQWHVWHGRFDFAGGTISFFVDGQQVPEGVRALDSSGMSPTSVESAAYLFGIGDGTEFKGMAAQVVYLFDAPLSTAAAVAQGLALRFADASIEYEFRPYDPASDLPAVSGTWFINDCAWVVDANNLFFTGMSQAGSVMGENINITTDVKSHVMLFELFQQDDHDAAAVIPGLDDKMITAFCRHGADEHYYIAKSAATSPPFTAFGAVVDIGAQITPAGVDPKFSYANLIRSPTESDRLYNFFRIYDMNTDLETWYVSWSDDDGTTWEEAKQLWGPGRPYTRPFYNSVLDRIELVVSESAGGSTWHCYYDPADGDLKKSDGTVIGPLDGGPYDHLTDLTVIHDDTALGYKSYLQDVAVTPISGFPIVGYTTFEGGGAGNQPYMDHRYKCCRWTGSAWAAAEQICAAGGHLAGQPSYSGGFRFKRSNPDIVCASRRVNASNNPVLSDITYSLSNSLTSDKHKLFKVVRSAGVWGTPTRLITDTTEDKEEFRPMMPGGTDVDTVVYSIGRYGQRLHEDATGFPSYSYYDTEMRTLEMV